MMLNLQMEFKIFYIFNDSMPSGGHNHGTEVRFLRI